ncbi:MAG: LytR C-terminal domain-containing protein [Eubacteriales bacterium]|nr:LytR C-terminal domain-containing protein [Eubacteriales bacterium]
MRRKGKFNQEKNPLQMVLYIVVVVLLFAFLVFLVYRHKGQKQDYEDEVRRAAANETEFSLQSILPETESETDAAASADENTAGADAQNGTNADKNGAVSAESERDSLMNPSANAETASGQETDTEETATEDETERKDMSILVLNGTKKEGVAGYWQRQLEEAGYTNVFSASYTGAIGEETVIFSEDREMAEVFKEQFPNGVMQSGIVEDGIETVEGVEIPERCEVYILVGSRDARSE